MTGRTTETPPGVEEMKRALREEFGDRWSIVHSSAERWWAFRRPERKRRAWSPGRVTEVDADTAYELRERLRAADTARGGSGRASGEGRRVG